MDEVSSFLAVATEGIRLLFLFAIPLFIAFAILALLLIAFQRFTRITDSGFPEVTRLALFFVLLMLSGPFFFSQLVSFAKEIFLRLG